jgi:hypothetical protein
MKFEKIVISINPDLKDRCGHFFYYDQRLKEVLSSEGYQFLILANKNARREILKKKGINCVLEDIKEYFPPQLMKKINFKSWFRYVTGCFRFVKHISVKETDWNCLTYFMYLSSLKYTPAFVIHAVFNGFKHRYILNLFQFHYGVGQTNMRSLSSIESFALNLVRRILLKMKIQLSTDSRRLNTKLGVDFDLLPMFSTTTITQTDLKMASNWDTDFKSRSKKIVSFPGVSRKGKGFDKACILIKNIILLSDDRFEFKLRNISINNEETLQRYLLPIKDDVIIYEGILTNELYKELFIYADIIFISYRRMEFFSRTSAVLSDAIQLNRPIIGPRDTWTGDVIEKNKFGSTFEDGSIRDMYRALCEVNENYEFYKKNLINYSRSWASVNSAEQCVKYILQGAF